MLDRLILALVARGMVGTRFAHRLLMWRAKRAAEAVNSSFRYVMKHGTPAQKRRAQREVRELEAWLDARADSTNHAEK